MVTKICPNCSNKFNVKNYRINTAKYCSYRCSATVRKKEEYLEKQKEMTKICIVCKCDFKVKMISKQLNKKTCSRKCQSILQGNHLQKFKKPIKKSKPDSYFEKVCIICGKNFIRDRKNKRVQCCSKKCGHLLANKNNKSIITEVQFKEAIFQTIGLEAMCNYLKCSASAVLNSEKRFGIRYKRKGKKEIRKDGYFDYSLAKNHRRIYELENNIKLKSYEGVHHLDGVKSNNELNNLFKTDTVSDHFKIHKSMEKIGFQLYRNGYIGFDKENKEYYIIKNKFISNAV